jgi:peptidoglycan DL-endopeptidase CwlO
MTDLVPAGDPEAMRATARALLAQADGIGLAPEGAVAGLEALVLEGPAAMRLRMASGEVRRQAQQAAAALEAVAAALQADATRVEQMNEELRLAAARAAQEAAATPAQATQPAQPPPAQGAAPPAVPDPSVAPPPTAGPAVPDPPAPQP